MYKKRRFIFSLDLCSMKRLHLNTQGQFKTFKHECGQNILNLNKQFTEQDPKSLRHRTTICERSEGFAFGRGKGEKIERMFRVSHATTTNKVMHSAATSTPTSF